MPPVDRSAIVDEFGDLQRKAREFAPYKRRIEALSKEIQSWYADEPAAKEFTETGKRFTLSIAAREYQTKVDPVRLYKLVGLKKFIKLVTITLQALKDAGMQTLEIHVADTTQTGRRDLKAMSKVLEMPKRGVAAVSAELDRVLGTEGVA